MPAPSSEGAEETTGVLSLSRLAATAPSSEGAEETTGVISLSQRAADRSLIRGSR
nr:MAG TPA: hypothetical protein [Caudoviricetes sp.]